jgi:hypothetical protein
MSPATALDDRLVRLQRAIERKQERYYRGTNTLLVVDDSIKYSHLIDLPNLLLEAVRSGLGCSYKRIFVLFGVDVRRIR